MVQYTAEYWEEQLKGMGNRRLVRHERAQTEMEVPGLSPQFIEEARAAQAAQEKIIEEEKAKKKAEAKAAKKAAKKDKTSKPFDDRALKKLVKKNIYMYIFRKALSLFSLALSLSPLMHKKKKKKKG